MANSPVDPGLISVVLPVLDAAGAIGEQLAALAGQDHDGDWELIVSDNGSTDGTQRVVRQWANRLPLRIVDASVQRGVAAARNAGVADARGARILSCDADDVVAPSWLRHLASSLTVLDLATGTTVEWDEPSAARGANVMSDAAANDAGAPTVADGYLPCAPGCNLGFRRETFDAVGGFDVALRRGEDKDFSWRAIRAGASYGVEPLAVVHHRRRSSLWSVAGQGFQDGRHDPLLFRRHGRWGMQRESLSATWSSYETLARSAMKRTRTRDARHRDAYDAGQRLGRLVGSVRHRTRFL